MGFQIFKMLDLEYFPDPEAVYNGLMVRFHGGRALTVRDRPPNVFRVAWHFLSLPPLRGFRPYPTSAYYTSVNSKHFGFCLVKIGPHSWSIWGFERCKMWRLAVLWPRSSQLWSWTFHWLLPYTSCSLWCSLMSYDGFWDTRHQIISFERKYLGNCKSYLRNFLTIQFS